MKKFLTLLLLLKGISALSYSTCVKAGTDYKSKKSWLEAISRKSAKLLSQTSDVFEDKMLAKTMEDGNLLLLLEKNPNFVYAVPTRPDDILPALLQHVEYVLNKYLHEYRFHCFLLGKEWSIFVEVNQPLGAMSGVRLLGASGEQRANFYSAVLALHDPMAVMGLWVPVSLPTVYTTDDGFGRIFPTDLHKMVKYNEESRSNAFRSLVEVMYSVESVRFFLAYMNWRRGVSPSHPYSNFIQFLQRTARAPGRMGSARELEQQLTQCKNIWQVPQSGVLGDVRKALTEAELRVKMPQLASFLQGQDEARRSNPFMEQPATIRDLYLRLAAMMQSELDRSRNGRMAGDSDGGLWGMNRPSSIFGSARLPDFSNIVLLPMTHAYGSPSRRANPNRQSSDEEGEDSSRNNSPTRPNSQRGNPRGTRSHRRNSKEKNL